ncbi:MAG: branched-chain amino acid ABC transporter permease [Verrucomicrobiae bacterium]|nr:branched-chain amino acid ABC transporter permease [Verrucomicrobiae bacterium]
MEFLQQILNGLSIGSIYALIALGYTMVYGVLRLINFAHGDVYMIGAMTGFYTATAIMKYQLPLPVFLTTLLAALVVCGLLGALIERVAYRPLRNHPKITLLITAIGVSLFLEYGGQALFGPDPKNFPQIVPDRDMIPASSLSLTLIDTTIFALTLVLLGILFWIVHHTSLGRAMRAVSENPRNAALMGVNVNRIISLTFVMGSVLAGAAGVMVGISRPKIEPLMGILPGIKAFAAAVLGGIGNLPGAVVGGLIIGLLETFISAVNIGGKSLSSYRDAVAFAILILILLVKPTGLFGKSTIEKV